MEHEFKPGDVVRILQQIRYGSSIRVERGCVGTVLSRDDDDEYFLNFKKVHIWRLNKWLLVRPENLEKIND